MSSIAYPQLAAVVAPQDMPAQTPVDQAMPPPQTAPNDFLHSLGQMLQDHEQSQSAASAPQGSSNPYAVNNDNNPYAVAGNGPLSGLAEQLQGSGNTAGLSKLLQSGADAAPIAAAL